MEPQKITKLTPKQESQIPVFIKKWVDKCSEPVNREKLPEVVKKLFGENKIVIIGESLQNTIDLIRVATGGKKLSRQLDSQLYDQLRRQLYDQLNNQLRRQLHRQLYDQLDSQLYDQLNSQLNSQLDRQLDSQLNSQLNNQLHRQLYDQLNNQLHRQLYDQLNNQLHRQLNSHYDFYVGSWWGVWCGWYDYGKYIGCKFDEEKLQLFFDYQETMPIAIFIGNVIFFVEKPKCYWNENGELHSVKHPAIRWGDGTGVYLLNGVKFDQEMFTKVTQEVEDGGLKPKEKAEYILKIEDVDQRTQAMRFLPPKELITALSGKKLDEVVKIASDGTPVTYQLYQFPAGEVFTKNAYYMSFNCPSTNKEHIEGVRESKTVAEAMARREDITVDEWLLKVPLQHEV